jgi:hypothetical protein
MLGEVTSVCLDCGLGKALLKAKKLVAMRAGSDKKYLPIIFGDW